MSSGIGVWENRGYVKLTAPLKYLFNKYLFFKNENNWGENTENLRGKTNFFSFLGVRDSDRPGPTPTAQQRERERAARRGDKSSSETVGGSSQAAMVPSPQKSMMTQREKMDEVCYQQCIKFLRDRHQVLVFVHSRNATGQLARLFIEHAVVQVFFFCWRIL